MCDVSRHRQAGPLESFAAESGGFQLRTVRESGTVGGLLTQPENLTR